MAIITDQFAQTEVTDPQTAVAEIKDCAQNAVELLISSTPLTNIEIIQDAVGNIMTVLQLGPAFVTEVLNQQIPILSLLTKGFGLCTDNKNLVELRVSKIFGNSLFIILGELDRDFRHCV